jgi:hypothetical protein
MRREGSIGVYVAIGIVGLVVLLPVVYVLALGPVVRLVHCEVISESVAETAYTPLIFVAENFEPFEHGLELYMELWEPAVFVDPADFVVPQATPAGQAPLPPCDVDVPAPP